MKYLVLGVITGLLFGILQTISNARKDFTRHRIQIESYQSQILIELKYLDSSNSSARRYYEDYILKKVKEK